MTQPSLHVVYLLNNQGCRQLLRGHRNEALKSFKSALTTIKTKFLVNQGVGHEEFYAPRLLPMSANVLRTHVPPGFWEDDNQRNSEGHHYFIFTNGIPCIPGHHFSNTVIEEGKIVSAIILFNLALTRHLQALDNNGCRRALNTAQSLYICSFRLLGPILQGYRQQIRQTQHVTFELLAMALLNNMAVAQWECQQYSHSEEAFVRLERFSRLTTSFVVPSRSQRADHQQHLDAALLYKVQSMLLNATVGRFNSSTAPAA